MGLNIRMNVAGYTHNREAIKQCAPGEPVYLLPDPTNQYDANAILVLNVAGCLGPHEGVKIGYIPAKRTAPVHRLLRLLALMEVDPKTSGHAVIHSIAGHGEVFINFRVNAEAITAWFVAQFDRETVIDDSEVRHATALTP